MTSVLLPEHLACLSSPGKASSSLLMLRLSSIRRGDLFIIQIIQAFRGTFFPPSNYQCILGEPTMI